MPLPRAFTNASFRDHNCANSCARLTSSWQPARSQHTRAAQDIFFFAERSHALAVMFQLEACDEGGFRALAHTRTVCMHCVLLMLKYGSREHPCNSLPV